VDADSVEAKALQNRLLLASGMWKEATDAPLPKLPPGDPAAQLEIFELQVVELLCSEATAESARSTADKTWDLVHDRSDEDPVKQAVVECHERLATLSAERSGDTGDEAAGDAPDDA